MEVTPHLTDLQRECMSAWEGQEIGYGFGFDAVAARCEVPKRLVRRIVRACARKGLLQFSRCLWSDDGEMAGAGYTLTPMGRDCLLEMSREETVV